VLWGHYDEREERLSVQITDLPAFLKVNWHALRMAKASALNMEFYNGSLPPAIILRLQ